MFINNQIPRSNWYYIAISSRFTKQRQTVDRPRKKEKKDGGIEKDQPVAEVEEEETNNDHQQEDEDDHDGNDLGRGQGETELLDLEGHADVVGAGGIDLALVQDF